MRTDYALGAIVSLLLGALNAAQSRAFDEEVKAGNATVESDNYFVSKSA